MFEPEEAVSQRVQLGKKTFTAVFRLAFGSMRDQTIGMMLKIIQLELDKGWLGPVPGKVLVLPHEPC